MKNTRTRNKINENNDAEDEKKGESDHREANTTKNKENGRKCIRMRKKH